MPRTHFPPEIKAKLEHTNKVQAFAKRKRISEYMDKLFILANSNQHVRNLKANMHSGCLTFRYNGRNVQYWLGAAKLVVRNPVAYTEYTDFSVFAFIDELKHTNPNNAFKLKEQSDGELCTESA